MLAIKEKVIKLNAVQAHMVKITIYKITGKQMFFKVPKRFCEECDLSVMAVKSASKKLAKNGIKVTVLVKPWINNFLPAILKGIWHPPGVVVNGRVISQGVVPSEGNIERAVLESIKP